ncbi:AT-rich interactive domain-containing protein 4A isoform X2 [Oryzias melastigma]|uniref:AT-rich interactive domain-containing protein 4A isoform X2 n=1 Tax=Oryzias melastigma TaxID=30732 RepID=UPI000CF7E34B|nr:AT-rich interactive domain-containing protein 4A isoform X2 [Oryzias melastigma]
MKCLCCHSRCQRSQSRVRKASSGLNSLLFVYRFAAQPRGEEFAAVNRSEVLRAGLPVKPGEMKAADEPAYLTVGTDVSAKYRGAFCEAKIKTVKRMVKVKVTLKGESASQVVQDDQVKGPLRVGSTVEVKTNEGLCSEAVISKLTDASLYTVVFDDGDEKTLRRTSLCLKGERHFAESETLDQLPLTNPEHFGTPVIGKKSNRGGRRSSQAILDEENDTTSSEEEEEDRKRPGEELLGQICSIENVEDSASWFLALVVSTSCNEELQVKKDQCLVRSFDDGKFCIVARRHVHVVTAISISRAQFLNRRGLKEAQMFLKNGEIPDVWKMDMSQILDTSSSEDDEKQSEEEEDEEEEEKKKRIRDEPEDEADPEERDNFLQQLYKFMEDRGTPINKPPVLGYKDLNLFKLFRLVYQQGGCHKIESGTIWKQIYMDLGIPVLNSAASYNVKTAYKKYLFGFEEYCRSASITFRTIHHNDPPPPALANHKKARAELKEPSVPPLTEEEEPVNDKREESDSESEREIRERPSLRGRRRGAGNRGKPPSRLELAARAAESGEEHQREARRRSNRRADDSERGSEDEDEEEEDEDEEAEEEARREDRSGDEEDGDSLAGTKVRVKYGRGKTQKIYEAHIKKTDTDSGEQFYLVHYYGWNVRYDEWVKADRIIWPTEKGTKRRQRKKNKEKDEAERDDEKLPVAAPLKPTGAKRGRPSNRTTPTGSAGRGMAKVSAGDGQSNGRSAGDGVPGIANGDDTPLRRTRRTSGMYDSDRASVEDSGSSSNDSESEEKPPKSSPWRGRAESECDQPEEEPEEEEEEEEEEEKREVPDIETPAKNEVVTATSAPLPAAAITPIKEESEDSLNQSERGEAEEGEEPAGETSMMSSQSDKESRTLPAVKMMPLPNKNKEATPVTSPSRAPPPNSPPPPPPVSLIPAAEEDSRAAPTSSPRVRGRKPNQREQASETPPTIQLCSLSPAPIFPSSPPQTLLLPSPPRSVLKRQEEPMVVLHCLPSQHLPVKSPVPNSDTDSASEEEAGPQEEEEPQEQSSSAQKRKAAEQRSAEKKLCCDGRSDDAPVTPTAKTTPGSSPKTLSSPLRPERRSEAVAKGGETQENPEERLSVADEKGLESRSGTAPIVTETAGPAPHEEQEPQIGPEALVCHEVDLDDPDEREKPASSENLLPIMREQQAPPPPRLSVHSSSPAHLSPPPPQPQVRQFVLNAAPIPCPEELPPANAKAEPASTRAEQEEDSSPGFAGSTSPSSTSLVSLQDSKDRGQKRGNECNSSPSAKKHKRSQKRPNTPGKSEKNGAGHSSDSEDQSRVSSLSKTHKSRCPALSSPTAHGKDKQSFPSPQRSYKWTLQLDDLDSMTSAERISFLQDKLQEIRKYYMSLKSEVASIDRRRKRLKKKEREVSNTTVSTSSGSSDTGMSPSSASPAQNAVAVECR